MSDAAKKKKKKEFPTLKSIDDIIGHYQGFTGKKFDKRIEAFETFHHPDNIHKDQLSNHAQYTLFGRESDKKGFPGAFNVAEKTLADHYDKDDAVIKDEDKLAEILEKYTDTFLEGVLGKEKLKKSIEQFKKDYGGDEGELERELREFKGTLMARYTVTDRFRQGINLLSADYAKQLKGKKRIEIEGQLRGLSTEAVKGYGSFLETKAVEGLVKDEDRQEMAEYISPRFEKRGFKHDTPHIQRTADVQASHYAALLEGKSEALTNQGYKVQELKHEDKKKK